MNKRKTLTNVEEARMVAALLAEPGKEPQPVAKPKTDREQIAAMESALLADHDPQQPDQDRQQRANALFPAGEPVEQPNQQPGITANKPPDPVVEEYMVGGLSFLKGRYPDGSTITRVLYGDGSQRVTIEPPVTKDSSYRRPHPYKQFVMDKNGVVTSEKRSIA